MLEKGKKGSYNEYRMTVAKGDAVEKGRTVPEAERVRKAARTDKHGGRGERYTYARENIQQFFDFTGADTEGSLNKRGRTATKVALLELKDFFQPMLKILTLKAMDEEAALTAAKNYQAWVKENPGASDAARGLKVDEELDAAMNK